MINTVFGGFQFCNTENLEVFVKGDVLSMCTHILSKTWADSNPPITSEILMKHNNAED